MKNVTSSRAPIFCLSRIFSSIFKARIVFCLILFRDYGGDLRVNSCLRRFQKASYVSMVTPWDQIKFRGRGVIFLSTFTRGG